jgi:AraC-like DNA-binding protein
MSKDSAQLLHRHFTVAHERKELQLPAWRDYLDRLVDIPIKRRQLELGFHGELNTYLLPDVVYCDSRTDAVTQSRSAARIAADNLRDFVFHVAIKGIVETTTQTPRPRSCQYTPGILALDLGQPMTMVRPAPAHVLAFFLPRAMVAAVLPDPDIIHGCVIAYTTPLTRLILRQIHILAHSLTTLPLEQRQYAIQTCAHMILTAYGKQQRLGDRERAAARAAVQAQIEQYIHANLHQESLSPESVLRAFPVGRSTIYRMFEPHGGLHAYIRHCRLSEAARELVALQQVGVAEIGLGLGFNSASDFSRAFSRQYSMSPSDYRELSF